MVDAMRGAAQNDETLGLINPAEWEAFALQIAENAPEIFGAAVQVLETQAQRNKFAIMLAAAAAAGALAVTEAAEPLAEVAHKFVFNDGLFGHPKDGANGGDGGAPDQTSTEEEKKSTCDPSADVDENSVCIPLACNDSLQRGLLANAPEASL